MPRWLTHAIAAFQGLRKSEKHAKIVVLWQDEEGELMVFHARNFREVKLWLNHEQAGTIH